MSVPKRSSGLDIPPAGQWLPISSKQIPPGGWRVSLVVNGARVSCNGSGPEQVLDSACRVLMDAGQFVSLQDTVDQVVAAYASRPGVVLGKVLPAVVSDVDCPSPSNYGRHLWAVIHLSCAVEPFSVETFVRTVEMAQTFIKDPNLGCEECAGHFAEYVAKNPYLGIGASETAQKWSYAFHSAVNARLRKPNLTFQQAASMWGWQTDATI